MAWYDNARRISDGAREVLRSVDEFGSAWEGATMRDVRIEGAGPAAPLPRAPRITPAPKLSTGLLVILGAVLLVAWR